MSENILFGKISFVTKTINSKRIFVYESRSSNQTDGMRRDVIRQNLHDQSGVET